MGIARSSVSPLLPGSVYLVEIQYPKPMPRVPWRAHGRLSFRSIISRSHASPSDRNGHRFPSPRGRLHESFGNPLFGRARVTRWTTVEVYPEFAYSTPVTTFRFQSVRLLYTFLFFVTNGFLKNDHLQSKGSQRFYRRFSSQNPRFSLRRCFAFIRILVNISTGAGRRSKIIFRYF